MLNLNKPLVIYYSADYEYRDHSGSGLSRDQRKLWREERRKAYALLRQCGFKQEPNFRTKDEAQKYADHWNSQFEVHPILGLLKVQEYSYA